MGSEKPHIRLRESGKKPSFHRMDGRVKGERAVRSAVRESERASATFSLRLFHQTSIFDSPRSATAEEGVKQAAGQMHVQFLPLISSLLSTTPVNATLLRSGFGIIHMLSPPNLWVFPPYVLSAWALPPIQY